MHLERTMDELERNLDNVNSYFVDLRDQVERELKDYNNEIAELKETISNLEEDADTADTQIQELMYQNSMLQLELMEVAGQLIHMRHELDISRKGV